MVNSWYIIAATIHCCGEAVIHVMLNVTDVMKSFVWTYVCGSQMNTLADNRRRNSPEDAHSGQWMFPC